MASFRLHNIIFLVSAYVVPPVTYTIIYHFLDRYGLQILKCR